MTAWLRSLHGRLILLVVAALVVAQSLALALHVLDRHEYISELNETIATRRMPAAVELLERLPRGERPRLAEALNTAWSRFSVVPEVPALNPRPEFEAMAAQLLTATAAAQRARAVRVGTLPEPLADGLRWSATTLVAAVRLDTGEWLLLERPLRPSITHALGRIALSIGLSALAVLAVVAWLARRITRPLRALTDAAERFGRGDSVQSLQESGPEDLRRTIRAFNAMSDRLQRFISDRTRLLAAISHDLRTPITALRLRTEMVEDEETRRRMQRSLEEMQRMVEATLQFTRAEAQQEPAERLDLGELVESVCLDVADAGGAVAYAPTEPVPVLARPTALGRALRNLVDNAVFYGGRAEVSVTRGAEGAVMRVDDPGPGIPEADRERVFEPFVRLDGSRSSDTGGIGLGLATARTTIHAHGGSIRLGASPLGGLRVEVVLPGG